MKRAFTIIELLVVISVLAILIGIAIPRFKGMQQQGNLAKVKAELDTFKAAIESYYTFSSPSAYPSNSYTNAVGALLSGQNPKVINAPPPYDPFGSTSTTEYSYLRSSNGKYYVVYSVGPNGSAGSIAISNNGTVTGRDSDDICRTNGTGCDGAPLPVANGAACTQNSGCISRFCASNNQCSDQSGGSSCGINADCQTNVCGGFDPPVCRYAGMGVTGVDSCTSGSDCQSGYCNQLALQCSSGANGQSCNLGNNCQNGYCVNGSCSASKGADGTFCHEFGTGLSCVHGYCDFNSSTCTDGAVGKGCAFGTDCQSGYCVNLVCSASAGNNGDTCLDSQSCASGHCSSYTGDTCGNGNNGDGCSFGIDCQSGYCVNNTCSASKGNNLDTCDDSGSCQSGICAGYACSAFKAGDGSPCSDRGGCLGYCLNWKCRTEAGVSGETCGDNASCASGICSHLAEGDGSFQTGNLGGGYCL